MRHLSVVARPLLLAATLAAFTLGWSAPARAQAAPPPYVHAQPARAFGDSVGVNVFLSWIDTAYGDFGTLQTRLRDLGVRYIRDGLCPTCTYHVDRLNRLAAVGIKANIIVGTLSGGDAQMGQTLAGIRDKVRGAVISVEAPNEPNLTGDSQWVQHAREYQQKLYARVKGDAALAHLAVLGPAVGWPASDDQIGDITPWVDRGNFHPYPGGATPYYNLGVLRLQNAVSTGSKPLVATEAGYHTVLDAPGGHLPASERATALYMPRMALEGFRGGIERTYIYQLADPWSDAARPGNVSPMENRFGLLRSDLSPKPSYYALRNLLRASDGASAPVASPGGLRFSLEGAGPDVRQLLLRSADGSYALVLWRGVSVWDLSGRVDVSPPADRVDVVLGDPISLARRFEPVASDAERQRWDDPSRIPVDLAGGPVVLRLNPPGVGLGGSGGRKAARVPAACAARVGGAARSRSAKSRKRCCRAGERRASTRKAKRRRARSNPSRRRATATWARACVSARGR